MKYPKTSDIPFQADTTNTHKRGFYNSVYLATKYKLALQQLSQMEFYSVHD